jgi:hypothetical protein
MAFVYVCLVYLKSNPELNLCTKPQDNYSQHDGDAQCAGRVIVELIRRLCKLYVWFAVNRVDHFEILLSSKTTNQEFNENFRQ